ncbi:MAG: hypothetical protein KA988_00580 [Longilinea sp.]|nr:hypothetical protein [Longilinea sp.]MCA1954772.1 hypothetical protein [Anaerolinea sp.]
MTGLLVAAAVSYALLALLCLAFGLIYLLRPKFMPYHAQAVKREWEALDGGLQTLLIALMRTAGGGLLATGLAVGFLLPALVQGQTWVRYVLPLVGLTAVLPSLYATLIVRSRTGAKTPVAAGAAGAALAVLGFVLSVL